jgi:hypothetical protein
MNPHTAAACFGLIHSPVSQSHQVADRLPVGGIVSEPETSLEGDRDILDEKRLCQAFQVAFYRSEAFLFVRFRQQNQKLVATHTGQ